MLDGYRTATRYALLEHTRNRLALGLLIVFMPLWYFLLGTFFDNTLVVFKLSSTGTVLRVNGHNLTLLTAGTNAIALIVGFTLFAAVRGGAAFDRRLVLCGLRQPVLLLAKLSALAGVAAAVSLYASVLLLAFFRPANLALVWLGFFAVALVYGAFGLLLGVLVRSELAGFFLIVMIGLFDTFLQNPLDNPAANKDFLRDFPAYAPTQLAVAGGFAGHLPASMLLVSLAWVVGFAALGLLIFWRRTRPWNARGRALPAHAPDVRATIEA
ncbi:MAG: hypothetical protein ACHQ4H_00565 [Ktedonobacterales bacterium]